MIATKRVVSNVLASKNTDYDKVNYFHFFIKKELREPISRLKKSINAKFELVYRERFTNSDLIRIVIKLREENRSLFNQLVTDIIKNKKIKLKSKQSARKKASKTNKKSNKKKVI